MSARVRALNAWRNGGNTAEVQLAAKREGLEIELEAALRRRAFVGGWVTASDGGEGRTAKPSARLKGGV